MIGEAELRRQAARWGVDPMVADLDYSLGWFIASLYGANAELAKVLFKGGTCLRKCYFGDYRFSEDLDFTATVRFDAERLLRWAERAMQWAAVHDGPDFSAAAPVVETLQNEYGSESCQLRVYYRGPLQWGGSPRAIRLDVTRDETLLYPPALRLLMHPYSDVAQLGALEIPCYALAEILAEKLRAITGQRRFAISRDLYDIHHLLHAEVRIPELGPALATKFATRGVRLAELNVERFAARRASFAADWDKRLIHLIRDAQPVTFEAAWQTALTALEVLQDYGIRSTATET